jgi:hypothetical protein
MDAPSKAEEEAALGTIKDAVAWRDEWPDRLARELSADPGGRYEEFLAWWRRGIVVAIITRLEAIPVGQDREAYLRTLKRRWLLRDERLYERLGIPRGLCGGFTAHVADVFDQWILAVRSGTPR